MAQTQTGAERLAQWIDRSKLYQVEAAKIIGMDHTQLNQILAGKRRPGLDNAVKIQQATGIPVDVWVPFESDAETQVDPETTVTIGVARRK